MNQKRMSYIELIYEDQFARYACEPVDLRDALIYVMRVVEIPALECTPEQREDFVKWMECVLSVARLVEAMQQFLDENGADITLNVEEDGGMMLTA